MNSHRRGAGGILPVGLLILILLLPSAQAQRSSEKPAQRNEPPAKSGTSPRRDPAPQRAPVRAPVSHPQPPVDRVNHGTLRHADTQVIERHEPKYPGPTGRTHGFEHHDVDSDFSHPHFWHGFNYGHHVGVLRIGFHPFFLLGMPYFYDDGIYYQRADAGYREVYPPLGAVVPDLPEGAIEIQVGTLTYYYGGGAFYLRRYDGFIIVAAPMGVTVPDPPPGAALVTVNGNVAYQFNGVFFRPIFVNGVTQYVTYRP